MRPPDPKQGRNVALGIVAGTGVLVAGVLVSSLTVDAIDPLYRFGPEPRAPKALRVDPPRAEADPFVPVRWSGFAAAPPARADAYDDPALLAGARPNRVVRRTTPPSPPAPVAAPKADAPVVEPLDLPPPITDAEIGEAAR